MRELRRLLGIAVALALFVGLSGPCVSAEEGELPLEELLRQYREITSTDTVPPGDRVIDDWIVYPEDAFYHNGGRVIDVTKPPFGAKGDGETDDTEAIKMAYNHVIDSLREKGWTTNPTSYVLYFPQGTYLVSDTIIYDGPRVMYEGFQWGGAIRVKIVGEHRERTEIRLADSSPGFDQGLQPKPLLAFQKEYMLTGGNNIPSGNTLENITVNTGNGNPGAIGVVFIGANTSTIANVTVKSEDGQGQIGIDFPRFSVQGYFRDITVDGFEHGIRILDYGETQPTLEYITLQNQSRSAIFVGDGGASIRKLHSVNEVPAITIGGAGSHVVIVDSTLEGTKEEGAAIRHRRPNAVLFARNVEVTGYPNSIEVGLLRILETVEGSIEEYVSGDVYSLRSEGYMKSLNLPVRESPILNRSTDFSEWANVDLYPGLDDSQRVQNAMNSGKPTIYFPGDSYDLVSPVYIPASVQHIEFLYTTINTYGTFVISEESDQPLFMTNGPSRKVITQQASRDVVLRNTGGSFSNPQNVPAVLYIENAANLGASESFAPSNQEIWARSINNEYKEVANFRVYGGKLWALGFKHEGWRIAFDVRDGGILEVLGGYRNQTGTDVGDPMLRISDSVVSFSGYSSMASTYREVVWDWDGSEYRRMPLADTRPRTGPFRSNYFIPLYVSYDPQVILERLQTD